MPATEPFPWVDPDWRKADSAEAMVRRFFDACEGPRKSVRTDRLLRRGARSALRGKRRYDVMNRLVNNRVSRIIGVDKRARRMQLISAHLLGLAYMRYVFELEPIASMDLEELIEISVPVVAHYLGVKDAWAEPELFPPGEDRFGLSGLRPTAR